MPEGEAGLAATHTGSPEQRRLEPALVCPDPLTEPAVVRGGRLDENLLLIEGNQKVCSEDCSKGQNPCRGKPGKPEEKARMMRTEGTRPVRRLPASQAYECCEPDDPE